MKIERYLACSYMENRMRFYSKIVYLLLLNEAGDATKFDIENKPDDRIK